MAEREGQVKILVVDDEPQITTLIKRFLGAAGHEVTTAANGDEAVLRAGDDWDIVITDLHMPGSVDGIGVLKKARETGSADVLIMTAAPEMDSAIQAIRNGAYDYLVKPILLEALAVSVQRCLEKRRLSRELAREKALRSELNDAYNELTRMSRVKHLFGQFVTPEVAEYLLIHGNAMERRGERRIITVLFADVRQFTPFSEAVRPEEAVDVLNDIFARISAAVSREKGIINKFLGDGVLALFGAPLPDECHAKSAARAAIAARDAVEELAESRSRNDRRPLRIGIGVNTGEVVAGCLGTNDRAEYSVIGHAVNLAARLVNEAPPGKIYLGPETVALLGEGFRFGVKDPMVLPGISQPVIATELIGR